MDDPRKRVTPEMKMAALRIFKEKAGEVALFLINGGAGNLPTIKGLENSPAGHCAMDALGEQWAESCRLLADLTEANYEIGRESRRADEAEKKLARLRVEAKALRAENRGLKSGVL